MEKIVLLVVVFVFMVLALKACEDSIDSKVESECRDCKAKYSWCKSYWKEKRKCGYE